MDLVELQSRGTRAHPVLEVRIDRRDGARVTVNDCARVSRALEERLDAGRVVGERYVLQVSSPGERPLRSPADWKRFRGRWASVLAPQHGGRLEGEIISVVEGEEAGEGEMVAVLRGERGEALRLPLSGVKEARLVFRL